MLWKKAHKNGNSAMFIIKLFIVQNCLALAQPPTINQILMLVFLQFLGDIFKAILFSTWGQPGYLWRTISRQTSHCGRGVDSQRRSRKTPENTLTMEMEMEFSQAFVLVSISSRNRYKMISLKQVKLRIRFVKKSINCGVKSQQNYDSETPLKNQWWIATI